MKRVLEAAVLVAALAVAATAVYQWRARRAADDAARAEASPALRPGTDAAPGRTPSPPKPGERGVSFVPMVKMSAAPRGTRRRAEAPPPPPVR